MLDNREFVSFNLLPSDRKTTKAVFLGLSTSLQTDLLRGYPSIFHFVNFQFKPGFFFFDMEQLTLSDIHMAKVRIKMFFQTTPREVSCLQMWFHCQILIDLT